MGTKKKPEVKSRMKVSWKKEKRIQSAFSLSSKRFINNRNISPPLTPDLAGKFSHTSAAFSLSHLLDAVVHWTIQRILGYFTKLEFKKKSKVEDELWKG